MLEQTQDMDICLLGHPEGLPEAAAGVCRQSATKTCFFDRSNQLNRHMILESHCAIADL